MSVLERAARLAPEIRRRLLQSYDAGKRDLPWRGEADPYRIWVAEVMLQQTRVETVVPYYRAWLERFPDLESLAASQEEEVLGVWEGLGYYSRARNLRRGAGVVRERFGGQVPRDSAELRRIPGVGEYTAGAVASIAFGEPVPAVDGNVRRVLSRLFDLHHASPAELRKLAEALLDPSRPGDFNQALMEFGATLCTPRAPRCGECPLTEGCLALERGTVDDRPGRKVTRPIPKREVLVLVAVDGGEEGPFRLLLRKRPGEGLLAGMWEFPGREREETGEEGEGFQKEVAVPGLEAEVRELGRSLDVPLDPGGVVLSPMLHQFTHLKLRYRPVLVRVAPGGRLPELGSAMRWVSAEELAGLPMSVAQRRIAREALRRLKGRRGE